MSSLAHVFCALVLVCCLGVLFLLLSSSLLFFLAFAFCAVWRAVLRRATGHKSRQANRKKTAEQIERRKKGASTLQPTGAGCAISTCMPTTHISAPATTSDIGSRRGVSAPRNGELDHERSNWCGVCDPEGECARGQILRHGKHRSGQSVSSNHREPNAISSRSHASRQGASFT